MNEILNMLVQESGVPIWLLIIMLLWSYCWKLIGLWTAGKKQALPWFIVIALFNTMGILEILYVFVFSKKKLVFQSKKKKSKK